MNQTFDVLVVGAGVIGCSTAYHLSKKGAKVMVVDRGTIGGHAASLTTGLLAAQKEADRPGPFFDLCRASRALFPALVEEVSAFSGLDPEFELGGVWDVVSTEEEKKERMQKARWQQDCGESVQWQAPEHLKQIHPGLGPNGGGLFYPKDGQINSGQWVDALAEASRRRGVRFLDQVGPVEFLRTRRRIDGVRIKDDWIYAGKTILCAGAWTSFLLDSLRLSLPLEPVKGQLMVLAGLPRAFRGPVYATTGYLMPRADGCLVIGATYERTGFDSRATLESQRTLADWASRWCPELGRLPVVEFQSGLRPGTADGGPVMGRLWDYENLFVSAGHDKSGVLLSPYSGRYMADGVCDGQWDSVGAPFSPERFREKPS